jgi:hypothetical protein
MKTFIPEYMIHSKRKKTGGNRRPRKRKCKKYQSKNWG